MVLRSLFIDTHTPRESDRGVETVVIDEGFTLDLRGFLRILTFLGRKVNTQGGSVRILPHAPSPLREWFSCGACLVEVVSPSPAPYVSVPG